MADMNKENSERILRNRISRLVSGRDAWSLPCYEILKRIRSRQERAFLCGGAVRDLLLSSYRAGMIPRDLDIVLGYGTVKDVARLFKAYKQRWNCYGGVSIQVKDWSIDIWSLQKTWACQENLVEIKGFCDFPKTTFLDIEAVAVQLFCKRGRKREIYSKGFFKAIASRTVEINLEPNPNPTSCIIRALNVARTYGFRMGPKLARYVLHYAKGMELEELFALYQLRYHCRGFSLDKLHCDINAIGEQVQSSSRNESVCLPSSRNMNLHQRDLWGQSPNCFRNTSFETTSDQGR